MWISPGRPSTFGSPSSSASSPARSLLTSAPGLQQQRAHASRPSVEQRQHDVRRLEDLVVAAERQRLGVGQCLLKAAGEFVHAHGSRT